MHGSVEGFRKRALPAAAAAALVGMAVLAMAQSQPRFEPQVERRLVLYDVLLETVRVETQLQGWTLRKICLDGQAYWIGFNETSPTGISVAYRDGKPEQCGRRSK